MKFYLLSDNTDALIGLRLAGIEGEIVGVDEDVNAAVERALAMKDVGILLVTHKLAQLCADTLTRLRASGGLPIAVEIPDRHGDCDSEAITRYVRESVGI